MIKRIAQLALLILIVPTLLLQLSCADQQHANNFTHSGVAVRYDDDLPLNERTFILDWVDYRLEEWIAHKAEWGCAAYNDDEMRLAARREPVIIHGGYYFPNGMNGVNYAMGFNYENDKIEITINYPPLRPCASQYDPQYVAKVTLESTDVDWSAAALRFDYEYSYGLRQLPHEWTHTLRGRWHP